MFPRQPKRTQAAIKNVADINITKIFAGKTSVLVIGIEV